MDYIHADTYAHSGGYFYSAKPEPYSEHVHNLPIGHNKDHSAHSSHLSLQSVGRNTSRGNDQPNGNYSTYAGLGRSVISDEAHLSQMPRSGSPSVQYYERESPYHNLPAYRESPSVGLGHDPQDNYSRHNVGLNESFGSRDGYPGSRNSYQTHGDGYPGVEQQYDDHYTDPSYHNPPNASYRDIGHPYNHGGLYTDYPDERLDSSSNQAPLYHDTYREPMYLQQLPDSVDGGHVDELDRYSDRHSDSFQIHPEDTFHGRPARTGEKSGLYEEHPSYEQDRYSDVPRQRTSFDPIGLSGNYNESTPETDVHQYRRNYDQGELEGQLSDLPHDDVLPRYHMREEPTGDFKSLREAERPTFQSSRDPEGRLTPLSNSKGAGYRGSFQAIPPGAESSRKDDPLKRLDGLPPVHSDPFADDPFHEQHSRDGSFAGLRDGDPYQRGPSPAGSSGLYRGHYDDNQLPDDYDGDESGYPPNDNAPHFDDYMDSHPYVDDTERPFYPEDEDLARRTNAMNLGMSITEGYDDRRTPSIDGRLLYDYHYPPDLEDVIEYLSSPDDSIKANAAAYLQHLAFNDDGVKAKTRTLGGIPPLLKLLNHELTEVHKNACGALQNLSFGKANDENKRAIKNEGGIPELIRLLRKTDQEDVMDAVTGILWNLSSCEDLKQSILEDGLTVLVNVIVIPYSGWSALVPQPSQRPWTTVFRNTTGILRNISSAGFDARKKLRECRDLVNALIHTLQLAGDDNIIDCKPVENVVCTLRNLSYRIQEVEDPDFYKKRSLPRNFTAPSKGETSGCFGGSKKTSKKGSMKENTQHRPPPSLPPAATEYRSLWSNDLMALYLSVLRTCTNPVSIEAAAGAIQNLTACDWEPAVECREIIRKLKGLPILVNKLNSDSHRVVCAAATALRNLIIDEKNKELVGKYSIQQLAHWLPKDARHSANKCPDDLTCAVLATLYEVVRSNQAYAVSLIQEDGLSRLKYINTSDRTFLSRTLKINHTILKTLWGFKALHPQYARSGFTEQDFLVSTATPRPDNNYNDKMNRDIMSPSSNHTTPYNTLSRPISGQGYDDHTLSAGRMPSNSHVGYRGSRTDMDGYLAMNQSNNELYDEDHGNYSRDRLPPDSILLTDTNRGFVPLDEPRRKPVGGVALFPNMPQSQGGGNMDSRAVAQNMAEPLYAQVNKGKRRNEDYGHTGSTQNILSDSTGEQAGADSWV